MHVFCLTHYWEEVKCYSADFVRKEGPPPFMDIFPRFFAQKCLKILCFAPKHLKIVFFAQKRLFFCIKKVAE